MKIFKMCLKSVIIVIFVFCISYANAQEQRFTGVISDDNGKSIPYASIYFNDNLISISNTNGEFFVNLNKKDDLNSIYITSVGYRDTVVLLKEGFQKIILKENVIALADISITALNFTEQLLQDCLRNGIDTTGCNVILLCRQYLKLDGMYKRFSEGIFNGKIGGVVPNKIDLHLLEARTIDNPEVKNQGLRKLRYGINIRSTILQPFQLFKSTFLKKSFDYKLGLQTNVDGVKCYKIFFNYNSKQVGSIISGGTIYITYEGHLLKALERNMISSDLKKRWFMKELYDITTKSSKLSQLELTSEIVSGFNSNRQPKGGLTVQIISDGNKHTVDDFSNAKDMQDLSNNLKTYNPNFWLEYYRLYSFQLPNDLIQSFSKFGSLDFQFSKSIAKNE